MRRAKAAIAVAAAVLVFAGVLGGGVSSAAINGFERTRVNGLQGFEPGVHVFPSGRVIVDSPNGLGAHSQAAWSDSLSAGTCVYSTNACFTKSVFALPPQRYPGGGDSEVAIGHNNRVYFADLWVGSNSVSRSDDGGVNFTAGLPFTDLPASDRQWLSVGPEVGGKDTVYLIYQQLGLGWPMFVRSDDSADTWTVHKRLTVPSSGYSGPLVSDDTGYVGFVSVDGGNVNFQWSANKGDTWTSRLVATNGWDSIMPYVGMSGDLVAVTWIDRTFYTARAAYSTDKGNTWTTLSLSSPGSAAFPSIGVRGSKIAVAWYQAFNSDGTIISSATNPNSVATGQHWKVMYSESTDSGTTFSGAVAISARVKLGFICTAGLSCSGGRELGDFMTVAIDNNDKTLVAYASYYDAPSGLLIGRQL